MGIVPPASQRRVGLDNVLREKCNLYPLTNMYCVPAQTAKENKLRFSFGKFFLVDTGARGRSTDLAGRCPRQTAWQVRPPMHLS